MNNAHYMSNSHQGRFPSNVMGEVEGYQKYFYCPKVSRAERHTGAGNNHPTVKPVALMKYLITLVTPPGGKVLDPFTGSGSTGMAAVELGYDFTGCELDPDYVHIAETRIRAWYKKTNTDGEPLPARLV
jgi:DNA modification methylase